MIFAREMTHNASSRVAITMQVRISLGRLPLLYNTLPVSADILRMLCATLGGGPAKRLISSKEKRTSRAMADSAAARSGRRQRHRRATPMLLPLVGLSQMRHAAIRTADGVLDSRAHYAASKDARRMAMSQTITIAFAASRHCSPARCPRCRRLELSGPTSQAPA